MTLSISPTVTRFMTLVPRPCGQHQSSGDCDQEDEPGCRHDHSCGCLVAIPDRIAATKLPPATSAKELRRPTAKAALRSKIYVWPRVESAVNEMLQGLDGPLLEQVAAIERMLSERPLNQRAPAAFKG